MLQSGTAYQLKLDTMTPRDEAMLAIVQELIRRRWLQVQNATASDVSVVLIAAFYSTD